MADNRCPIYINACCFIDMVKEALGQPLTSDRANDVWYLRQITQANRDNEIDVYIEVDPKHATAEAAS